MLNFKKPIYYLTSILFIISLIALTGCNKPKQKSSNVNLELKDGLLYKIGNDTPYTGTEEAVVKGRRMVYEVVNGKKSGSFKIYYENKNLAIEGQLDENKNTGLWKYYFPNGAIESEGNFKNDSANGEWKWYFKNSALKEKGNFEKGKKEGKWFSYDENGKVIKELMYKDGKEIDKK